MCRLMSLGVRLFVYCFTFLTCLSLGVSSLLPASAEAPVWERRWDGLSVQAWSSPSQVDDRHYLIDHAQARALPLSLPADHRWGSLSVSPWSDAEGQAEAVAPCYRTASSGGGPFWGIVRVSLPAGRILDEIELDMLPTGRPCWLPQHPGRILFGAGDGRLYVHDFRSTDDSPSSPESSDDEPTATRPLGWACSPPGRDSLYLADPSIPDHPRLQHLVVAAVINRQHGKTRRANDLTQIWWLRIDPDRRVIAEAGLLDDPNARKSAGGDVIARFPQLVSSPDGAARLLYVARHSGRRIAEVHSLAIELEPASGRPRIPDAANPVVTAGHVAMVPPVVSSDGQTVFFLSADGGEPIRQRLTSPPRPALAAPVAIAGQPH